MTKTSEILGPGYNDVVAAGLRALGVENFVLVIHDQSFPSDPDEDTGRGSPYSRGAHRFLGLARALGFNGVQLGPQGQTSRVNPSPYDGTLFSRNGLSIALEPLTEDGRWGNLLARTTLDAIVASRAERRGSNDRPAYTRVFDAQKAALDEVYAAFRVRRDDPHHAGHAQARAVAERLAGFASANAEWLENDSLFEALSDEHGTDDFRQWHEGARDASPGARRAPHACTIERYSLIQMIAHEQHDELRRHARALGLKLFGDLQVGISARDLWSRRSLFLPGYLMGAPPSRTNPDGQPWSYPVLDPAQYMPPSGATHESAVLRFMRVRLGKLLAEFDGIRLDHPHGLVCPWVYRADDPDPLHAVQTGARLFDSPDLPDHAALAPFAVARRDQLSRDAATPRYADGWVASLTEAQVAAYSALFDVVVEHARENGRSISDIVCEVLSTQPYPLGRVMERFGLGRFRVTQKANLSDPSDVYRTENAQPRDWIMVGNHDTKPIWLLVDTWAQDGTLPEQAVYLAARLAGPGEAQKQAFARALVEHPNRVAEAKLADLFSGGVKNVMVFFPDLFGMTDVYNRPGVVSEENWTLRVSPTYEADYAARLAASAAFNIPSALAMAMRARSQAGGRVVDVEHLDLIQRLETLGARLAGTTL